MSAFQEAIARVRASSMALGKTIQEYNSKFGDQKMKFPKVSTPIVHLIDYRLLKTKNRLTFDILWQHPELTFGGEDDGDYFKFVASNGYEIISRSRMDIQTERLWLLGAKENERSGSMVFSSDEKRDAAYIEFLKAIQEWTEFCKCNDDSNRYNSEPGNS